MNNPALPLRGFFITGTGTGVGKTLVTAALTALLKDQSYYPFKAVQTGCFVHPETGRRESPDLNLILRLAGFRCSPEEKKRLCPFLYTFPCSPHLAAETEEAEAGALSVQSLLDRLRETAGDYFRETGRPPHFLLEGSGGILVPLNWRETLLDLMKALLWPVILVAGSGLGTINHSLLSLSVLRQAGLDVRGIVFNQSEVPRDEDRPIYEDNPEIIRERGTVRILARIPYTPDLTEETFSSIVSLFSAESLRQ